MNASARLKNKQHLVAAMIEQLAFPHSNLGPQIQIFRCGQRVNDTYENDRKCRERVKHGFSNHSQPPMMNLPSDQTHHKLFWRPGSGSFRLRLHIAEQFPACFGGFRVVFFRPALRFRMIPVFKLLGSIAAVGNTTDTYLVPPLSAGFQPFPVKEVLK